MEHTVYDIGCVIFRYILDIFFKEIQVRGSHKIPENGIPVIFVCAPHSNQFIDPLLLMTRTTRRVSFLTARKSMLKKWIVPVDRPQDLLIQAKGRVYLSTDYITVNAEFTTIKPKSTLYINNESFEIQEVVSDIILRLKIAVKKTDSAHHPFRQCDANFPSEFKIMPFVDHSEMFKSVTEQLCRGDCVGVFPEGGSHDRADFLPLKAGFAIMALNTMSEHPNVSVKLVPCGLNYFHPDRFRSRAVIEFGDVIEIPKELVVKYKNGGSDKREAIATLMDDTLENLKSITSVAPDYATLMVLQAARRLYKPRNMKLALNEILAMTRHLAIGYAQFQHVDKVVRFTNRVMLYNSMLKMHGIKDHQVKNVGIGGRRALLLLVFRAFQLILLGVLIIPGLIMNFPVIFTARYISDIKMKEAKEGSNVKILGKDVVGTWKVMVAMIIIPVSYLLYTFTFALFLKFQLQWDTLPIIQSSSFFFVAVLPSVSLFTIQTSERASDIMNSLRSLVLCLLPGADTQKLLHTRNELQLALMEVVDEYGPKTFDNFEDIRVVKDKWLKIDGYSVDLKDNDDDDDVIFLNDHSKLDIGDIDKIYYY